MKGLIIFAFLAVFPLFGGEPLAQTPFSFKAQEAKYKEKVVVLTGDVEVEHSLGTLKAQQVEIYTIPEEKSPRLKTILLKDSVNVLLKEGGRLTSQEADLDYLQKKAIFYTNVIFEDSYKGKNNKENKFVLKGHKMTIDHVRMITLLESSPSEENIGEKKQVFFEDSLGEIFADKVELFYKEENEKFILIQIKLQGSVKLKDRNASDNKELHYGLADEVLYDPQSKEITFTALRKKRVLFFDKVNNLQISAPSLKIRRDKATKKELIQGFGDVRFSFLEKEFLELQKKFQIPDIQEGAL